MTDNNSILPGFSFYLRLDDIWKNEAFSYYASIFAVSISSSLPHANSVDQQWVKLEVLRLKVDFLCQEKLVDDLLSSLRRNLNNMQMPTEDGLLLWETTNDNHTESYMPWQLVLTIVKVKANKYSNLKLHLGHRAKF